MRYDLKIRVVIITPSSSCMSTATVTQFTKSRAAIVMACHPIDRRIIGLSREWAKSNNPQPYLAQDIQARIHKAANFGNTKKLRLIAQIRNAAARNDIWRNHGEFCFH